MKNALLVMVSLAVALLAFEWAFFPWFLQRIPVRLVTHLPEQLQSLTGRSALAHRLPGPDAIALIGDSNAFGSGDHAYEVARSGGSLPYHSAHEIQKITGRDVLTFGEPGGNPVLGAQRFMYRMLYFKEAGRYAIPEPKQALIYFFEGNDMQDLLNGYINTLYGAKKAGLTIGETSFDILNEYLGRNGPLQPKWHEKHFPGLTFIGNLIAKKAPRADKEEPPSEKPTREQIILVDGKAVALPARIPLPPWRYDAQDYQMLLSWLFLELNNLKEHHPQMDARLVYLPATFTVYAWASEEIDVDPFDAPIARDWWENQKSLMVDEEFARSNQLCQRVERIARDLSLGFIDARPGLRAARERELLHGPKDWAHFNRRGYETLGGILGNYLKQEEKMVPCGVLGPNPAGSLGIGRFGSTGPSAVAFRPLDIKMGRAFEVPPPRTPTHATCAKRGLRPFGLCGNHATTFKFRPTCGGLPLDGSGVTVRSIALISFRAPCPWASRLLRNTATWDWV